MIIEFFEILFDYLFHFAQTAVLFLTVACLVAPITWGVYCVDCYKEERSTK